MASFPTEGGIGTCREICSNLRSGTPALPAIPCWCFYSVDPREWLSNHVSTHIPRLRSGQALSTMNAHAAGHSRQLPGQPRPADLPPYPRASTLPITAHFISDTASTTRFISLEKPVSRTKPGSMRTFTIA